MASIKRNVNVKIRVSALLAELRFKGDTDKRPGKEGAQSKSVTDLPPVDLPYDEYAQRISDAMKVIGQGWQLIAGAPPEAFMGGISVNQITGFVTFDGKIVSNNVSTSVNFEVDVLPTFATHSDVAANETPVQDADPVKVTATTDLHTFPGITFYVRIKATDGTKTVYSVSKSFEMPIFP
jgi:hypothetical protein